MAFSTKTRLPIAQLDPSIDRESVYVQGVITLVWPYSASKQTWSFLLVEPDFRLRRTRGQVRVVFDGAAARRTARCGIASGDEISLAIAGARWEEDKAQDQTPGKSVGWTLAFGERVVLERIFEGQESSLVDTNHMGSSPEPERSVLSITPPETPNGIARSPIHKAVSVLRTNTGLWSSPAFLKQRDFPSVVGLGRRLDPFLDDDDAWEEGPPAKRAKFGRASGQWRFVERTPSSEPEALPEPEAQLSFETEPGEDLRSPAVAAQEILEPAPVVDSASEEAAVKASEAQPLSEVAAETGKAATVEQENDPIILDEESDVDIVATGAGGEGEVDIQGPKDATETIVEEQSLRGSSVETEVLSDLPIPVSLPPSSFSTSPQEPYDGHNIDDVQIRSSMYQELLFTPKPASPPPPQPEEMISSQQKSPALHIDIEVQGATPRLDSLDEDGEEEEGAAPDTPRLRPLLSPGLDIVSPLETRSRPLPIFSEIKQQVTEPFQQQPIPLPRGSASKSEEGQPEVRDEDEGPVSGSAEEIEESSSSLATQQYAEADGSATKPVFIDGSSDIESSDVEEDSVADVDIDATVASPGREPSIIEAHPFAEPQLPEMKQHVLGSEVFEETRRDPTPELREVIQRPNEELTHSTTGGEQVTLAGLEEPPPGSDSFLYNSSEDLPEENAMPQDHTKGINAGTGSIPPSLEKQDTLFQEMMAYYDAESNEPTSVNDIDRALHSQVETQVDRTCDIHPTNTADNYIDPDLGDLQVSTLPALGDARSRNDIGTAGAGVVDLSSDKDTRAEEDGDDRDEETAIHSRTPPVVSDTPPKSQDIGIEILDSYHDEAALSRPPSSDEAPEQPDAGKIGVLVSDDAETCSLTPDDAKRPHVVVEKRGGEPTGEHDAFGEEQSTQEPTQFTESVVESEDEESQPQYTMPSSSPPPAYSSTRPLTRAQSRLQARATSTATVDEEDAARMSIRRKDFAFPQTPEASQQLGEERLSPPPDLSKHAEPSLPTPRLTQKSTSGLTESSQSESQSQEYHTAPTGVVQAETDGSDFVLNGTNLRESSSLGPRPEDQQLESEATQFELFSQQPPTSPPPAPTFSTKIGASYAKYPTQAQETDGSTVDFTASQLDVGLRTPLSYYTPLASIHQYYNQLVDLLAICVSATKPARADKGPRDYTQTLYVVDPSSLNTASSTVTVQLFRPFARALPKPGPGDVMLLRDVKVQTQPSKGQSNKRVRESKWMLTSTSTSAWAAWRGVAAGETGKMEARGPPIEVGPEERGVVKGLRKWWDSLTQDVKAGIENAVPGHAKGRVGNGEDKAKGKVNDLGYPRADSNSKASTKGEGKAEGQESQEPVRSSPQEISSAATEGAKQGMLKHTLRSGARYSDEVPVPRPKSKAGDGPIIHELRDGRKWRDDIDP